MLSNGIYEQIVNQKLAPELEKMEKSGNYDIKKSNLNADDCRAILTIYLSYVIRKGLYFVRSDFKSKKDEEALLAQIKLCNSIIDEIAEYVNEDNKKNIEDQKILEQGEVLTSLYEKMNSARSVKNMQVVRPETSIVENALFTGSKAEPSMLSELKKEIVSSDRIDFLVSFIKWSAIRPLLPELKEFTSRFADNDKENDPHLRIIATTYTKATDYKAIEELAKLPSTEVKINYETNHERLHAKSYLFKRDTGFSTAYIGSSNLSNPALNGGLEWNVKVTEKESIDIVKKFAVSFESYWNDSSFETFDPDDEKCCQKLRMELNKHPDGNDFHLQASIHPYAYQQEILDRLDAERKIHGYYKNLVVAATGVGKTIVAAFDYKRFKETHPRARLLFIAHREEILKQSIEKFREVLNDFNFGEMYVGGNKPDNIDYLFASIQSINSGRLTEWTTSNFYDYIVIDEAHHMVADSYQSVIKHYKPRILLGLTATPDRMDHEDILKYFDNRIASEMLLGEAIDRNLLSSFQYFGVTDSEDYSDLKWGKDGYEDSDLENLYTGNTRRCELILKSVKDYVADLNDVKGIGFCVNINHAIDMAKYFNEHGVHSMALYSDSKNDKRKNAQKKLVNGEIKFIFVVDLYNEGVDIPEVNTILFLRPTQSATVFLQQLGRGLRLCPGKECLTVLDFIGQYNRNYNFEAKYRALVGQSRKSLTDQIENGFSSLPSGCYIQLEEQSKKWILENLRQNSNNKRNLVKRVASFEENTGKKLTLANFLDEYNMNLYDFYSNNGSRSMFLLKKWAGIINDSCNLSEKEYKDVYKKLIGLFHINSEKLLNYWISYIKKPVKPQTEFENRMLNMLYYTFYKKFPEKNGFSSIEEGIHNVLKEDFIKNEALEILNYKRSHIDFIPKKNEYDFVCPLEVGCQYNTRQIMAAFGEFNEKRSPEFREGVKYFKDLKTDIFLINLNKSEKDFSPSTMYEDYAINDHLFHWQSQSRDKMKSEKIQRYIHHKKTGNNISFFVREFKNIGSYTSPYTFLGNADYVSCEAEQPVNFIWKLHEPIPGKLLEKANKAIAN